MGPDHGGSLVVAPDPLDQATSYLQAWFKVERANRRRAAHGVEPICRVLLIAAGPTTPKRCDLARLSARAGWDAALENRGPAGFSSEFREVTCRECDRPYRRAAGTVATAPSRFSALIVWLSLLTAPNYQASPARHLSSKAYPEPAQTRLVCRSDI